MSTIALSEIPKHKKFQLAAIAGYNIIQDNNRYRIEGADNYIDNDFRSIDDILRLISNDLIRKGFMICR